MSLFFLNSWQRRLARVEVIVRIVSEYLRVLKRNSKSGMFSKRFVLNVIRQLRKCTYSDRSIASSTGLYTEHTIPLTGICSNKTAVYVESDGNSNLSKY
jgi:hypothetical protein